MNGRRDVMQLVARARPAELDVPHEATLRDRVRRAALARPAPGPRRRRIGLMGRRPAGLALAAVATAAIAALEVLAGPVALLRQAPPSSSPPPPGGLPSSASVGASMLTAYRAAGGEILHVHDAPTQAPDGVHVSDTWWAPQDASVGQEQRVRTRELVNGVPFLDAERIYVVPPASAGEAHTMPAHKAQFATGESIVVYYPDRAWSDNAGTLVPAYPNADRPDIIADDLQHGYWRVVARQEIGGRSVLELQQRTPAVGVTELWVDAQTYLPLKRTNEQPRSEVDYQFLPATPANLALLQPPIPTGFARQPQAGPTACRPGGCG